MGLAAPAVAFARDATPAPSPSTSWERDRTAPGHDKRLAEQRGKGRPDARSKADRQAMLKERLDRAVSDGKLTRQQADALVAAAEAGVFPAWGGWPGGGGPKHGGPAGAPADGGESDTPAGK
ncbi:hypothetical protein V1634_09970 [Plantactinospora veratri]|uniref:Uncharacterized protein n=1 Tax=Plantactinospora veratri TaxID=1436122 RepID=A0ABU7SB27_9ACTN